MRHATSSQTRINGVLARVPNDQQPKMEAFLDLANHTPRCRDSVDCIIATWSPPDLRPAVNPLTVELAPESWEKRVCNPIDAQQIAADAPSDSARFEPKGCSTCH